MSVITVIDERGRDLIINNTISVPKDKVTIIKHNDFCELRFDKHYYSQVDDKLLNFLEVYYQTCTDPATTSNDELFQELHKLKD